MVLRRLLRLRARQQKLVIKFLAIKYSCRNVLVVSGAILALLTTSRAVFVLRVRSSPSPRAILMILGNDFWQHFVKFHLTTV